MECPALSRDETRGGNNTRVGGIAVDILITGRHVEIPEELRAHVRVRAMKLTRFYDRVHDVEVVFDHESEQFTAELIVRLDRKHTMVTSDIGPEALVLVDRICNKMEHQLSKYKEKVRSRKGGVAADGSKTGRAARSKSPRAKRTD